MYAQILKICKIQRKVMVKQTSTLFCKYLRNESLDLYEILGISSYDSSEDPCMHTRARGINMRAPILLHMRAFTPCAQCTRAHEQIFTKNFVGISAIIST